MTRDEIRRRDTVLNLGNLTEAGTWKLWGSPHSTQSRYTIRLPRWCDIGALEGAILHGQLIDPAYAIVTFPDTSLDEFNYLFISKRTGAHWNANYKPWRQEEKLELLAFVRGWLTHEARLVRTDDPHLNMTPEQLEPEPEVGR